MNDNQRSLHGISNMVGNTPLLKIDFQYKKIRRSIYAKSENFNLTGSIKDRIAYNIIDQGYASGMLKSGGMIIESTSGNTGIAVCAIGRAMGHPVTIFMPDWLSQERKNMIKGFGAEIILVSKEEGGFLGCIKKSEELAATIEGSFLARQFSSKHNPEAHYKTTGPEIWWQLKSRSLTPDAFVAGVGTGGTIMGTGRYLKEKNPNIKLHPLEPANMPILSTGHQVGKHRIEGIADDFVPPIVDLENLDDIVGVYDGDAILMAQKLSRELGLCVGISSGANFIGAILAQNKLGDDAVVVTVLADDNKKYLSTDLMREEPIKAEYIAPDVKLLGMRAINRVCKTCCNPEDCNEMSWGDMQMKQDIFLCPRRTESITAK